jgi:uroporphyrinogen decarboxylase
MNHRERILRCITHQEPDRLPIDIGATAVTTIMPTAYNNLKKYLGLEIGETSIVEPLQMVTLIDHEISKILGSDAKGLFFEPKQWRTEKLYDGSRVRFPARLKVKHYPDGSDAIMNLKDEIQGIRSSGSPFYHPYSFDHPPLVAVENSSDLKKWRREFLSHGYGTPPFYLDKSFSELGQKAKYLYEETSYFIVARFSGHVFSEGWFLRGYENFMLDLLVNPGLVEALMDIVVENHIHVFDKYIAAIGKYIHAIQVADDLGQSSGPLISPETYRMLIKPYHKKLFDHIKSKSDVLIFMHSDGGIRPFIPDLIEIGVDILNPLEISASGMDGSALKRDFGDDIIFWGGGCDNSILSTGTPEDVKDEVKRNIDALAPDGGYVFAPIQSIMPEIPPENIVAMYETAIEYGIYS